MRFTPTTQPSQTRPHNTRPPTIRWALIHETLTTKSMSGEPARPRSSQSVIMASPPLTIRAQARAGECSATSSSSHTAAAPARRSCGQRAGGARLRGGPLWLCPLAKLEMVPKWDKSRRDEADATERTLATSLPASPEGCSAKRVPASAAAPAPAPGQGRRQRRCTGCLPGLLNLRQSQRAQMPPQAALQLPALLAGGRLPLLA